METKKKEKKKRDFWQPVWERMPINENEVELFGRPFAKRALPICPSLFLYPWRALISHFLSVWLEFCLWLPCRPAWLGQSIAVVALDCIVPTPRPSVVAFFVSFVETIVPFFPRVCRFHARPDHHHHHHPPFLFWFQFKSTWSTDWPSSSSPSNRSRNNTRTLTHRHSSLALLLLLIDWRCLFDQTHTRFLHTLSHCFFLVVRPALWISFWPSVWCIGGPPVRCWLPGGEAGPAHVPERAPPVRRQQW